MKSNLKRLCIYIVLILSCFLVVGCNSNNGSNDGSNNQIVTITNSITATVTKINSNNVMVSLDNHNYSFDLTNFNKTNNILLFAGDEITIDFTGAVTSDKEYQDKASVTKITIVKYADLQINPKWITTGIFSDYYDVAYRMLLTMTDDEKIGQVLFSRVPEDKQVEVIMNYHLGGYIMFGRDFSGKTVEEVTANVKSYQVNSKIPLIIAVDEEGGDVVRISSNPNLAASKFKSSQQLYKEGGFDAIKNDTNNKSKLLSSLGINMNLAPVSDVSTNSNDYIYDRSFGQAADLTSTFVKTVIDASKDGGVTYTLKHFPGYGNNVDTHTGIAIDNRSLDSFKNSDFLPFEAGIEEGAAAILVNHNVITAVDSKTPASLSKNIHDILRNELKFTGIVMTDDLAMNAIKDYTTNSPAVDALNAGNDLLIITDFDSGFNDIKNALNSGSLSDDTLNQAVLRVLAYKYYAGIIK